MKKVEETKYWKTKKYTPKELRYIVDWVILPQFGFSLVLCAYIFFRFSFIEGLLLVIISIIFSKILFKKWGATYDKNSDDISL